MTSNAHVKLSSRLYLPFLLDCSERWPVVGSGNDFDVGQRVEPIRESKYWLRFTSAKGGRRLIFINKTPGTFMLCKYRLHPNFLQRFRYLQVFQLRIESSM